MLHFVAKRFKTVFWERLKVVVEGGLSGGSSLGVR